MLQSKASLTVVRRAWCVVRPNHAIRTKGMTLVEVMLAVAVIIVAALGTLCYEYLCVDHIRFARAQLAATRLGQLLIEDWKSTGGAIDYDPASLGLGFTTPSPEETGDYFVTLDNQTFFMQLDQRLAPIANNPDTVAGVTINQISVTVRWRKDYTRGAVSGDDPAVTLTTYVRRDT